VELATSPSFLQQSEQLVNDQEVPSERMTNNYCIRHAVSGGSIVLQNHASLTDHLFRLLKYHSQGYQFHNDEEAKMVLHEWLWMQILFCTTTDASPIENLHLPGQLSCSGT
jgi:hypothetical protein